MNLEQYASYDGLGLAALARKGDVSAAELARLGLEAIAALNPALNAVIEVYVDAACKVSTTKDAPFHGVPFLLKDIGSHDANVKFELGSRLTEGMMAPPFASELVKRFRSSGVSILGRTNIPEMGSSCTTEPILFGPTRNPWNLDRTPGGSSGGAAAAVAAGLVPIAHANDAGGSIRWPASCCGLVGLKPSRNLNPVGPDEALPLNGLAAEHIVSKSVRDTAAMLDVTAGPDTGAWCYTPRLNGSYLDLSRAGPGSLRIGINLDPKFPPTELQAEVIAAVLDTGKLCESIGHHVEEARFEFEYEQLLKAFSIIWSVSLRTGIDQLSAHTGRKPGENTLEPHVLAAWRDSEKISGSEFNWALSQMNGISRAYGNFFRRYDVMLTPVGAGAPFELGTAALMKADNFFDWFMEMTANCPFLSTVNLAGLPAISLPLSWSKDGLPIGSHFIAPMAGELTLLQLATQLETAQPWSQKVPPTHIANS